MTFAQEKKDTVVWIPKAQIIQVLENQKRELQDDIKMVEGKLEFLYVCCYGTEETCDVVL
jgi:hypothetical protein